MPTKQEEEPPRELTVCDIMGEWGWYQTSLTSFAVLYSAILSMTIVVGPLWTPNLSHVCAPSYLNQSLLGNLLQQELKVDFTSRPHECYTIEVESEEAGEAGRKADECLAFIYDDERHGKVLTNTVSFKLAGVF